MLRYAAYLSALPLASTALGVTGSMFAVESVAFNGYLLLASARFWKNPTDANAKSVFRCSLWYLPLVLALMLFHSKSASTLQEQRSKTVEYEIAQQIADEAKEKADAAFLRYNASDVGMLISSQELEQADQNVKQLRHAALLLQANLYIEKIVTTTTITFTHKP